MNVRAVPSYYKVNSKDSEACRTVSCTETSSLPSCRCCSTALWKWIPCQLRWLPQHSLPYFRLCFCKSTGLGQFPCCWIFCSPRAYWSPERGHWCLLGSFHTPCPPHISRMSSYHAPSLSSVSKFISCHLHWWTLGYYSKSWEETADTFSRHRWWCWIRWGFKDCL